MSFPSFRSAVAHAAAALCLVAGAVTAAQAAPIHNVVLVHGAFVGGAGWRPVYDILTRDGYNVTLVQEPLTSFKDDVTATRRVIDSLDGPCVLVGHSYGGAIITEAGNDEHVKSLVYIAAHALDVGETEVSNGKRYPNATPHEDIVKTADDYLYLNPADYPRDFAADLPIAQAEFEAHEQMPTAAGVFASQIPDPAWKIKPTFYMVAKADKIINPDLERMYAKRAHAQTVEVDGASHSVYESHPNEVAALIERAAQQQGQ